MSLVNAKLQLAMSSADTIQELPDRTTPKTALMKLVPRYNTSATLAPTAINVVATQPRTRNVTFHNILNVIICKANGGLDSVGNLHECRNMQRGRKYYYRYYYYLMWYF